MTKDAVGITRAMYKPFADKNRAAIETILADDFYFTSPLDNRNDRATYFERCWPNSERIESFDFVNLVADGDRVVAKYEGQNKHGHRFRNTEIVTLRDGNAVEVEGYLGWSIPYKAPLGGLVDP